MKPILVRRSQIPNDCITHIWIERKYGLTEKFKGIPIATSFDTYLKWTVDDFDPEKSLQSVLEAFKKWGWWGYLSHFKDCKDIISDRTNYYGGFSITCNPDLPYSVPEQASTLGEPKANLHDFLLSDFGGKIRLAIEERGLLEEMYHRCFTGGLVAVRDFLTRHNFIDGTEVFDWNKPFRSQVKPRKNSYFDPYGFRQFTQPALYGAHGEFLKNKFKRKIVRSRVACINGRHHDDKIPDYMWHVDEPIFYNLRLNIPLQTTDNYVFEIKDRFTGKFDVGYGYTWNTEVLHRVYAKRKESSERIHMVIGVSPWFDYVPEEDMYISNEFLGEMH